MKKVLIVLMIVGLLFLVGCSDSDFKDPPNQQPLTQEQIQKQQQEEQQADDDATQTAVDMMMMSVATQ
jgi:major membrane immunogen (membrane-anchored lipoprotein)